MNSIIRSVNSFPASCDGQWHKVATERIALSGPDQSSISPRQTEALLPKDLVPVGQGQDQQDVENHKEQSRHNEEIRQVADKANEYLEKAGTHLEFIVGEETGRIVISVIQNETNEVIRKIPPESLTRLADRMAQMRGLLFEAHG